MGLEWWYWIIAGVCLIGLELLFPSFTIIWFGLGALAIGVLKALWPAIPLLLQLLLWPAVSICFTVMWFKYLKPKSNMPQGVLATEDVIGETGTIVRDSSNACDRWTVRFQKPVLGADEWCCYSDEELQVADTVLVTEIEGQVLKVVKL